MGLDLLYMNTCTHLETSKYEPPKHHKWSFNLNHKHHTKVYYITHIPEIKKQQTTEK